MALRGWLYPASWPELAQIVTAETVANMLRDKKDKPLEIPKPWPDEVDEPVSDEDRTRLKQELAARSAFS